MLKEVVDDAKNYERHLQRSVKPNSQEQESKGRQRFAASVVVSVSYGRRINSLDEWIVKENMNSVECEEIFVPIVCCTG